MRANFQVPTISLQSTITLYLLFFCLQMSFGQVESELHHDELEFSEAGTSKANVRYNGLNLTIDNNETNGDVYMQAARDIRIEGLDDVIIEGNDDLLLATNNVTRLFINQDGDVGVGTAFPEADVEIEKFNQDLVEMRVTNSTSQFHAQSGIVLNSTYDASTSELVLKNSDWAIVNEGDWNQGGILGFYFDIDEFQSASDLKMRIRPSGDVWVESEMSAACYETRGGCDIVEGFDSENRTLEPGDVVVIDVENPGQVKKTNHAYDKKVLGIISGANGIQPGIKLSQEGVLEGEFPIAMAGQVYVKVKGKVTPGDLLTTSTTAGHAQSVTDFENSHGSVIGKALTGNEEGQGLVLVFVNLH